MKKTMLICLVLCLCSNCWADDKVLAEQGGNKTVITLHPTPSTGSGQALSGGLLVKKSGSHFYSKIQALADRCFDYIDFSLSLNGGLERREYERGPKTSPFAQMTLSVPLFSSGERHKKHLEKGQFIERLLDLAGEIESVKAELIVKKAEVAALKTIVLHMGVSGLKDFYKIQAAIGRLKSKIQVNENKLKSWLAGCN